MALNVIRAIVLFCAPCPLDCGTPGYRAEVRVQGVEVAARAGWEIPTGAVVVLEGDAEGWRVVEATFEIGGEQ